MTVSFSYKALICSVSIQEIFLVLDKFSCSKSTVGFDTNKIYA
jgi:hypothetical protein